MSTFSRHWSFGNPLAAFTLNRRGDWMALGLTDGTVNLLPAADAPGSAVPLRLTNGEPFWLVPDADEHGFLAGAADGRLWLIDPAIGTLTDLMTVTAPLSGLAAGANGLRAIASDDSLFLLNPAGTLRAVLRLDTPPLSLQFNPCGKRLVLRQEKDLHLVWVNAKKPQHQHLSLPAQASSLFWRANGTELILALDDSSLLVASPDGKRQRLPLPSPARLIAPDASGAYVFAAQGRHLWAWPLTQTTQAEPDHRALPIAIDHMAPHPSAPFMAVAAENGAILLVPYDGRPEAPLLPATGKRLLDLVWSPSGDLLFAPLAEGGLLLFPAPK
jgi:hypothetical protein